MDPFIIMAIGTQKFKTKTLDEAGKNPVWFNEVFDFDVKNIKDELQIQVFDEDPTTNDLVGE